MAQGMYVEVPKRNFRKVWVECLAGDPVLVTLKYIGTYLVPGRLKDRLFIMEQSLFFIQQYTVNLILYSCA